MVTAMLVGRSQQSVDCRHTGTGNTRFTFVLVTIAVAINKHLTDHVTAIGHWIRHDAHRCFRDTGRVGGKDIVVHHRLVDVFTFADAATDNQQQLDRYRRTRVQCEAAPTQLATVDRRLGGHVIQLGGTGNVLEARRHRVDDVVVRQGAGKVVVGNNGVRHQVTAHYVYLGSSLRQRNTGTGNDRVQRNVVVEQLAVVRHRRSIHRNM